MPRKNFTNFPALSDDAGVNHAPISQERLTDVPRQVGGAHQIDVGGNGLFPQWLLWQLVDSAFPSGGFAHSSGLEAAWQLGQIRTGPDLSRFLQTSLQQLGHAALPLVGEAHRAPERLSHFDRFCEAFTTNHVANRASRRQGRAFLSAVAQLIGLGSPPAGNQSAAIAGKEIDKSHSLASWNGPAARGGSWIDQPPFGHLPPVFGAVLARLGCDLKLALRMFCFIQVRGWMAAAVRLNIIGPTEAQKRQYQLGGSVESIVAQAEQFHLEDLAQTAPLLDLVQGTHDRLTSRLFQS